MEFTRMKFTIEIRDYESGGRELTVDRIEAAIKRLLDHDGSDGIVIVKEAH